MFEGKEEEKTTHCVIKKYLKRTINTIGLGEAEKCCKRCRRLSKFFGVVSSKCPMEKAIKDNEQKKT